jgi:hypothetical protein
MLIFAKVYEVLKFLCLSDFLILFLHLKEVLAFFVGFACNEYYLERFFEESNQQQTGFNINLTLSKKLMIF